MLDWWMYWALALRILTGQGKSKRDKGREE
jgi:hypothetical protein